MTEVSRTLSAIACICAAAALVQAADAPAGILGQYTLSKGPIIINEIPKNSSGATFNSVKGTLFICPNYPPAIMEIGLDGSYKRTITLTGFNDTEGLTWISGTKYAIIQERRGEMTVLDIEAGTTNVNIDACETYPIDSEGFGNKGIEGISYNAKTRSFYIVKEKLPRKIYEVVLPAAGQENGEPAITNPWDLELESLGMSDVAGVYYHAASDHLLILGEENKCIVESTLDGKEVSRLSLTAGSAGFDTEVFQPEGITMDSKGNIYIVSEPNSLYILTPAAK